MLRAWHGEIGRGEDGEHMYLKHKINGLTDWQPEGRRLFRFFRIYGWQISD